jgi:hypothetical protein
MNIENIKASEHDTKDKVRNGPVMTVPAQKKFWIPNMANRRARQVRNWAIRTSTMRDALTRTSSMTFS